jgi:hypothetical protein
MPLVRQAVEEITPSSIKARGEAVFTMRVALRIVLYMPGPRVPPSAKRWEQLSVGS